MSTLAFASSAHFSVHFERKKNDACNVLFLLQNEGNYMEIYGTPLQSMGFHSFHLMHFRIVTLSCPWAEQLSGTANTSVDLALENLTHMLQKFLPRVHNTVTHSSVRFILNFINCEKIRLHYFWIFLQNLCLILFSSYILLCVCVNIDNHRVVKLFVCLFLFLSKGLCR